MNHDTCRGSFAVESIVFVLNSVLNKPLLLSVLYTQKRHHVHPIHPKLPNLVTTSSTAHAFSPVFSADYYTTDKTVNRPTSSKYASLCHNHIRMQTGPCVGHG